MVNWPKHVVKIKIKYTVVYDWNQELFCCLLHNDLPKFHKRIHLFCLVTTDILISLFLTLFLKTESKIRYDGWNLFLLYLKSDNVLMYTLLPFQVTSVACILLHETVSYTHLLDFVHYTLCNLERTRSFWLVATLRTQLPSRRDTISLGTRLLTFRKNLVTSSPKMKQFKQTNMTTTIYVHSQSREPLAQYHVISTDADLQQHRYENVRTRDVYTVIPRLSNPANEFFG